LIERRVIARAELENAPERGERILVMILLRLDDTEIVPSVVMVGLVRNAVAEVLRRAIVVAVSRGGDASLEQDVGIAKPPKGAKGKDADEAKKWEWNNAVMKMLKDAEKARGKKLSSKDMATLVQPLMAQYGFGGAFEKYKGKSK
jgi:hypothetical protein